MYSVSHLRIGAHWNAYTFLLQFLFAVGSAGLKAAIESRFVIHHTGKIVAAICRHDCLPEVFRSCKERKIATGSLLIPHLLKYLLHVAEGLAERALIFRGYCFQKPEARSILSLSQ